MLQTTSDNDIQCNSFLFLLVFPKQCRYYYRPSMTFLQSTTKTKPLPKYPVPAQFAATSHDDDGTTKESTIHALIIIIIAPSF
jgi:hypothetical protein